jgi:plasmid replication initiation protein
VHPDWFYRGVIDRSLVLAIDPAYFQLAGGIERWLCRIAHKLACRRAKGWLSEIAHLTRCPEASQKLPDSPLRTG